MELHLMNNCSKCKSNIVRVMILGNTCSIAFPVTTPCFRHSTSFLIG